MKKIIESITSKKWLVIIIIVILATLGVWIFSMNKSQSYLDSQLLTDLHNSKDWPKENWPNFVVTTTADGKLWAGQLYKDCESDLNLNDYSTPLSKKMVVCYTANKIDVYEGVSLLSSKDISKTQSEVERTECYEGYCYKTSDAQTSYNLRKVSVSENNYIYVDYDNFIVDGKNINPIPDKSDIAYSHNLSFLVWKDSQCNMHTYLNGVIDSVLNKDCAVEFTDADTNKNSDILYATTNSDDPNSTSEVMYQHIFLNNKIVQIPKPFNDTSKFNLNSVLFQLNTSYATSTEAQTAFCFDAEPFNKKLIPKYYIPDEKIKYTVCNGKIVNYTN